MRKGIRLSWKIRSLLLCLLEGFCNQEAKEEIHKYTHRPEKVMMNDVDKVT